MTSKRAFQAERQDTQAQHAKMAEPVLQGWFTKQVGILTTMRVFACIFQVDLQTLTGQWRVVDCGGE